MTLGRAFVCRVVLLPLPRHRRRLTAPSEQPAWPSTKRPSFDLNALDQLLDDCSNVCPTTLGTLVVTRLTEALDLTGAMLLARPGGRWVHTHPHTTHTREVQAAVTRRAQALFNEPPEGDMCVEVAADRPIRLLPLWSGHRMRAVLCLGPKRSGQPYKPREEVMLRILARTLALRFAVIAPEEMGEGRLAGQVAGESGAQPPASGPLSPCETAVLGYLAQGLSDKDIAARAQRSVKTIQIHIEHIYEKLGVHSRTRALHVARRRHLLLADGEA